MSQDPVTLDRLHACERNGAQPLFVHRGESIGWRTLCADVGRLRAELAASERTDWALFHADACPFAVALLALLGAGKRVWLPANATSGTEAKLAAHCEDWLGPDWSGGRDIAVATGAEDRPLAPLTGRIVVFTSGSSGEPQPIEKDLRQFDREVASLESLWGALLGSATIVSTVSHQHIYGLLFRVLWPLCAGRVSYSERFAEVGDLLAAASGFEAAAWISSPAHLKRLHPELPWEAVRDRLRAVFSSGGPLPAETAAECARLSGIWPTEVYGSSESGGIAVRTQADGNVHWQPLPGVQVRPGADGALELRSPHLADAGWMAMSDAVEVAPDGRFVLGDRLDRIVKVEGKRLSLNELENSLVSHPWLAEARALLLRRRRESVAVVAVPSAEGRERLRAMGRHDFSRRLREGLLADFDPVTLPRLWRFLETLPSDAQGKTGRAQLVPLFERTGDPRLPDVTAVRADGDRCELELRVPERLGCFDGHFPGLPVVPGVALIGWAEHFARHHMGVAGEVRDLEAVKFSKLVRPGDALTLQLVPGTDRSVIRFRFRSADGAADCASGRLLLAAPVESAAS